LQFRHYSLLLAGAVQHRVHGAVNGGAGAFRAGAAVVTWESASHIWRKGRMSRPRARNSTRSPGARNSALENPHRRDRQIRIDLAIDAIHQLSISHPVMACTITILAACAEVIVMIRKGAAPLSPRSAIPFRLTSFFESYRNLRLTSFSNPIGINEGSNAVFGLASVWCRVLAPCLYTLIGA